MWRAGTIGLVMGLWVAVCARSAAGQGTDRERAEKTLSHQAAAGSSKAPAANLRGFRDGVRHYQKKLGRDNYRRFAEDDVRGIADSLLLWQRANGGWAANQDPLRMLSAAERAEVEQARDQEDTSFDNRCTYPQVQYLAYAYGVTGEERYAEACRRGIAFTLAAQYGNGGWPHTYPNRRGYYPRITIVDDVMSGILRMLREVAAGSEPFAWVEEDLRGRCRAAVARGEACLLALQVRVGDRLTVWAGQYDEVTLEPAQGRTFEPPALISGESAEVLRYLMDQPEPSAEMVRAIEAGAAWLARVAISGKRLVRVPAEEVRYEFHTSRDDVVEVEDPSAPRLWARYYDLQDETPVLTRRDGRRVRRLADLERERRTGHSWYGPYAERFLTEEYPRWQRRVGHGTRRDLRE